MERVWDSEVYKLDIEWSIPKTYEEALNVPYDQLWDTYFYKILGQFNSNYHLIYIGKTYTQFVTSRLLNPDHVSRRKELQKKFPKHTLLISFGHIKNINAKRTRGLIDEVESLLIYSHSSHEKFSNKSKISYLRIAKEYHLRNLGFRKEGMLQEIALGLFCK